MSALFSFKQIIKALANTFMPLVCVIVIMLMTASCSTMTTKQATSTNTTASSLTAKEKSDNETTAKSIQQATECRYIAVTGSRFGKKICRTKEAWAEIAKKHEKAADELVRGLTDQSGLPPTESGMGKLNTPTTP